MTRFTPDPSFYATAAQATAAPPERLAYVATIGVGNNGSTPPDALGVLDLDPGSSSYGLIVSRLEMPNVGDELHHFGWNACSSALCPWMPHSHRAALPRRAGLAVVAPVRGRHRGPDHAANRQDDRAGGDARKIRLQPRAHGALQADGIYVNALGSPDGDGRAGFVLDHDTFQIKGAWSATAAPSSWPTTSGGTSATTA